MPIEDPVLCEAVTRWTVEYEQFSKKQNDSVL